MIPSKVFFYGVTGSGKTTLARRFAEKTGLPFHAVDDLTWEPGWLEVPVEEQRRRIAEICEGERWVLDSAYGQWLEVPLAHTKLIVCLDYSRALSLARLVKRTLIRNVDGKTICNGNRESLRQTLSRNSIIVWHFKSFARKRERILKWSAEPKGFEVLRFKHPREAEHWLRHLP